MKAVLGCYRTTPTDAMEIESGLPPPWIRLQTKVLCSFTRMQSLAQSHPIHESLANGLHTRTSNVKYRSNAENILQQFPVTTAKIGTISPFTQPPWCTATDAHQYEAVDNTQSQAYQEKETRVKQLKVAANEQWTAINAEQPPSHLNRILLRHGSEYGPALYNRLTRNTCAKVIQLRTGHCGLNAYLHRFGLADSPTCDCDNGMETEEHFLLE